MAQEIQNKIKRLFGARDNPGLEVFKMLEEFEQKSEKLLEKLEKEARLSLKQAISEEIERFRSQASDLVEKAVQEQIFKGISQIKGEQGDPGYAPQKGKDYWTKQEIDEVVSRIQSLIRIPQDGKPGKNGVTPIAGTDYPTTTQIRTIVKKMIPVIPTPKDGKTPQKGIDYFTPKEISQIVKEVKLGFPKVEIRAEDIRDKLQSLKGNERLDASAIKNLSALMGAAKRVLHRGGLALEWESLTLSADGSSGTLTYTPYTSSTVMIFYNGSLMTVTTNYTLSGRTVTFLQPIAGSEAWAFYRKA